ncbi:MAG: GntR family transcriptional regulator [Anaerolineales bacterium]
MPYEPLARIARSRSITGIRQKVELAPLQDRIYHQLRAAFMAGEFSPQEPLVAKEIAARLGTSMMPVRDALRRLETIGVITITPQRGSYVRRLTSTEMGEVAKMRALLESEAVTEACTHMTDHAFKEIKKIDTAIKRAVQQSDLKEAIFLNAEFHHMIYRCSNMPFLCETVENLWLRTGPYLKAVITSTQAPPVKKYFAHHAAILNGLAQRDAAAASSALLRDIRVGTKLYHAILD